MKLAPERHNSYFIAVFKAVVGLATTLAAVLGGWLAQSSLLGIVGGETAMTGGLKLVFLISFLGRIASLSLLAAVVEPGAESVRDVVLALVPGWQRRRRGASWVAKAPAPHLCFPVASPSPLARAVEEAAGSLPGTAE